MDHLLCEEKRKCGLPGQNLFLLRQFASKLKTMRFTMGTLTVLFYGRISGVLGCINVYGLAESGFRDEISI